MNFKASARLSPTLQKKERFLTFVGQKERVRNILVIRDGLLGDVVFITPVLRRLRSSFPDAFIDVMVGADTVRLLEAFPGIRTVFALPKKFSILAHVRIFLGLRRFKYDVVVICETNSHYTIMASLLGARFLCGLENSLSSWLDVPVPWQSNLHFVNAALGIIAEWTEQNSDDRTTLFISKEEKKATEEFLREFGILGSDYVVCIHPGCSSANSERQWIPSRYSELADRVIQEYGAKILFTGLHQDEEEIEIIRAGMKGPSVSLAGKTPLRLLLSLLDRADLVVGPYTGTLHIACALRTPVVMLVGAADPRYTGPFDPRGISRFERVELPCIACARRDPKPVQWETCKTMRPVMCMEMLHVEQVFSAIEKTRMAAKTS